MIVPIEPNRAKKRKYYVGGTPMPECPECGHKKSKISRLTGNRRCNACFKMFTANPIERAVKDLDGNSLLIMKENVIYLTDRRENIIRRYDIEYITEN